MGVATHVVAWRRSKACRDLNLEAGVSGLGGRNNLGSGSAFFERLEGIGQLFGLRFHFCYLRAEFWLGEHALFDEEGFQGVHAHRQVNGYFQSLVYGEQECLNIRHSVSVLMPLADVDSSMVCSPSDITARP